LHARVKTFERHRTVTFFQERSRSMKCRFHEDREAYIKCQKMEIGYCQECLENCEACTDPCGYCKFRTQCVIWELCKKSEKKARLERESKGEA
jgi:hypothetical protein